MPVASCAYLWCVC